MKVFRFAAVLIAGLLACTLNASGKWGETPAGLPYYTYEGHTLSADEDPAFLLGNYRISLMTHASGLYQIMSGERSLAWFNADPEHPDRGLNRTTVYVDNKPVELVGYNSLAADPIRCIVETGIGFTKYDYYLDGGLRCARTISVMPSEKANGGNPCFLVTVTFTNTANSTKNISYVEALSPGFVPIADHMTPADDRDLKYPMITEVAFRYLKASFAPVPQRFMHFPTQDARSRHEVAPQSLFLYAEDAFLSINEGELKATFDFKLRSGKSRTYQCVIGFADKDCKEKAEAMLAAAGNGKFGAYESQWKNSLPDFSSEREKEVRRELYWNAHMLESSAMYDSYFGETFIPAGAEETYVNGKKTSNTDHLEAVLPLSYFNQDLAKSALRYVMRHMDFDGRIHDGNEGYGSVLYESSSSGEIQTALMYGVAEYLRITGDYDFLDERMYLYPIGKGEYATVMEVLEQTFLFARDFYESSDVKSYVEAASASMRLAEQLEASGKASSDFLKALKAFHSEAFEGFDEEEVSVSGLNFEKQLELLKSPLVSASFKRNIYDYLLDDGIEDYLYDMDPEQIFAFIYGISTFDTLDARSMLRKCTELNLNGPYPGGWSGYSVHAYSWPLYCHYMMSE